MADSQSFDLIVIGAGPGGYVAAIRAAQLGLTTAIIDENPQLGGTCLRVGCIPSKAMLESSHLFELATAHLEPHGIKTGKVTLDLPAMLGRKEKIVDSLTKGVAGLMKKNKIAVFAGRGSFESAKSVTVTSDGKPVAKLTGKHILIATGSTPTSLKGVEIDGKHVVTSTEALSFDAVPKHLIVIGAGYIGLEMGSVWRRLGSKVTVLEFLDRILPGMDDDLAKDALKLFKKQGIEFHLGAKVTGTKVKGGQVTVEREGGEPITADKVLVAVGRKPNTAGLALDKAAVKTDERGRIVVDAMFQTSTAGVYAIGDVIAGPMLAHKAMEEGVACAEGIVKGHAHVNYDAIPAVCYTHPEIASVGKTEQQLKDAAVPYRAGTFPFAASGRAKTLGETDGRIKILAHAETDRVLGVHIIGPRAGDLIAEAVVAMDYGASSEDLARSPAAHPTLAEALKEAALAVDGRVIHF